MSGVCPIRVPPTRSVRPASAPPPPRRRRGSRCRGYASTDKPVRCPPHRLPYAFITRNVGAAEVVCPRVWPLPLPGSVLTCYLPRSSALCGFLPRGKHQADILECLAATPTLVPPTPIAVTGVTGVNAPPNRGYGVAVTGWWAPIRLTRTRNPEPAEASPSALMPLQRKKRLRTALAERPGTCSEISCHF